MSLRCVLLLLLLCFCRRGRSFILCDTATVLVQAGVVLGLRALQVYCQQRLGGLLAGLRIIPLEEVKSTKSADKRSVLRGGGGGEVCVSRFKRGGR